MMSDMGWFASGFGWLLMLLLWGLVILGLVALVRWLAQSGSGKTQEKTALDILKERYARGEIDREEYEQKRTDLEK
jgi:putative membrane protein